MAFMQPPKPLTVKQWKLLSHVLSYAFSNWGDVQDCFEEDLGPESEVAKLMERARLEGNEPRKLALCYFSLYPKEAPTVDSEEMWDSIDCTFLNWLNTLYEDPTKALSKTGHAAKMTKAYFAMIGFPKPDRFTQKWQMVEMVQKHWKDQQ